MVVFRLARETWAKDLSGKGAELSGGRWNSKRIPMLYTGQNIALCVSELAVHLPLGIVPKDYCLIHIEVPDNAIFEFKKLPKNWNSFPHSDYTQQIGDKFIKENKFLLMKVPSASVQGEFNYLVNTRHKNFGKVKIKKVEKFGFDERLFVR